MIKMTERRTAEQIEQPIKLHKDKAVGINELATALSKAQASIEGASKDATNPHFKSKYSDLSSCWAACRKALSDNGLAVIQIPRTEGNQVTVNTILTHSSGQFISGELSVMNQNQKNQAQGIGSCITYLRRYALCSFVGISPEEDDGQAAGQAGQAGQQQQTYKGPSPAQLKRLFALLDQSAYTADQLKETMKKNFKTESTRELTQEQYNKICEALAAAPKAKVAEETAEDKAKVAEETAEDKAKVAEEVVEKVAD